MKKNEKKNSVSGSRNKQKESLQQTNKRQNTNNKSKKGGAAYSSSNNVQTTKAPTTITLKDQEDFLRTHLEPLILSNPVPSDSSDNRYTQSFDPSEQGQILEFFHKYGFVVVRDVLTNEECQRTFGEIMDIMEQNTGHAFRRNDRSTWDHWPANSIEHFGSVQRAPIFSEQFLKNRCNPNVYNAFRLLLNEDNLMVSQDRACFYRPTVNVPGLSASVTSKFRTVLNLHLDMNPWNWMDSDGSEQEEALGNLTYGHRLNDFIFENNQVTKSEGPMHLQAGINLLDNFEEDGGFLVVPHFHKVFDQYFTHIMSIGDRTKPSYGFTKNDPILKYSMRVALRPGSIVLWSQNMPHGSGPNYSSRPRSAQFIKMFPTSMIEKQQSRFKERCSTIRAQLKKASLEESELSELAQQLLFNKH